METEISVDVIVEDVLSRQEGKVEKKDLMEFFIPMKKEYENKRDMKRAIKSQFFDKIPTNHKETMLRDPSLYYLFFYLLLDEKVVAPETPITNDYSVQDAMIYLTEDVWNLDLEIIGEDDQEIELDLKMFDDSEFKM